MHPIPLIAIACALVLSGSAPRDRGRRQAHEGDVAPRRALQRIAEKETRSLTLLLGEEVAIPCYAQRLALIEEKANDLRGQVLRDLSREGAILFESHMDEDISDALAFIAMLESAMENRRTAKTAVPRQLASRMEHLQEQLKISAEDDPASRHRVGSIPATARLLRVDRLLCQAAENAELMRDLKLLQEKRLLSAGLWRIYSETRRVLTMVRGAFPPDALWGCVGRTGEEASQTAEELLSLAGQAFQGDSASDDAEIVNRVSSRFRDSTREVRRKAPDDSAARQGDLRSMLIEMALDIASPQTSAVGASDASATGRPALAIACLMHVIEDCRGGRAAEGDIDAILERFSEVRITGNVDVYERLAGRFLRRVTEAELCLQLLRDEYTGSSQSDSRRDLAEHARLESWVMHRVLRAARDRETLTDAAEVRGVIVHFMSFDSGWTSPGVEFAQAPWGRGYRRDGITAEQNTRSPVDEQEYYLRYMLLRRGSDGQVSRLR